MEEFLHYLQGFTFQLVQDLQKTSLTSISSPFFSVSPFPSIFFLSALSFRGTTPHPRNENRGVAYIEMLGVFLQQLSSNFKMMSE